MRLQRSFHSLAMTCFAIPRALPADNSISSYLPIFQSPINEILNQVQDDGWVLPSLEGNARFAEGEGGAVPVYRKAGKKGGIQGVGEALKLISQ